MKLFRLGNDIHFSWYIKRFCEPESFQNKTINVNLYDKYGNKMPIDFTTDELTGSIKGTFYGRDQINSGTYRLELVENEDLENQVVLDYIDVFTLSNKLKNTTMQGNDSVYGIATETIDMTSNINHEIDLSGYVTKDEIPSLEGLVTIDQLDNYYTKEQIDLSQDWNADMISLLMNTKQEKIDDLESIRSKANSALQQHQSLAGYAKTSDIPDISDLVTASQLNDYALKTDLDDVKVDIPDFSNTYAAKLHTHTQYVTETALNSKGYITEHQDLSSYAKKTDIPDVSGLVTASQLNDYALKTDLDDVKVDLPDYTNTYAAKVHTHPEYVNPDYSNTYQPKGNYLTEHQSLAGYAKTSDIPDVSSFITASDLPDYTNTYAAKVHTHPEYVNPDYSNTYQPKGNYLTEHQDLSNYALKSETIQIIDGNEYATGFPHVYYDSDASGEMVINGANNKLNFLDGQIEFIGDEIYTGTFSARTDVLVNNKSVATQEWVNSQGFSKGSINTSKFLDKTSTGTNTLAGKIQIGTYNDNITNAILHVRNVGDSSITGAKVNGACFSINGDGTATLQHKIYNDSGTGAKNSAILRLSNKGLQFAVNSGNGASPSEADYKNIATVDQIPDVSILEDKINDLQLYKFPNATIIGTPTINNGQISNFSTDNYLQFPFVVNFQNRPFEINMAFTTGNNVTTQENILDSNFGLAFAVANSHFVIALSSNGTSWNIGAPVGTYTVQPNTAYYVKIKWDGETYTVEYSLDNTEFIADITVQSNANLSPKQIIIGKSLDNRYVFGGIINFNYASLEISDKIVWSGMDDVGLATRLATDMSNIDEAGVSKIKEITDISNYLPLSGGTMTGNIICNEPINTYYQKGIKFAHNVTMTNNSNMYGLGNTLYINMPKNITLKAINQSNTTNYVDIIDGTVNAAVDIKIAGKSVLTNDIFQFDETTGTLNINTL